MEREREGDLIKEEDLVPLDQLDLSDPDEEDEQDQEPMKFGCLDIMAFTIAAYQIVFPMLFVFIAVILVVYLVLRLISG